MLKSYNVGLERSTIPVIELYFPQLDAFHANNLAWRSRLRTRMTRPIGGAPIGRTRRSADRSGIVVAAVPRLEERHVVAGQDFDSPRVILVLGLAKDEA